MNPDQIALQAAEIPFLAVAICRTRFGNFHTGVVYRHSSGGLRFFHQAWHHDTRDESLFAGSQSMEGPFFCVVPNIDPARAKAIAAFWEFIASQNQRIAYALWNDPTAYFDLNTGVLVLRNGRGLSCSTFVLVLFRSASLPLIDTTGWPPNRPGDREAQENLLRVLEDTCQDQLHIQAVRAEIGCERVRPEEIAGAAMVPDLPVQHPLAEDAGLFILGSIHLLGHYRHGMLT
jgi:hypothetical protein